MELNECINYLLTQAQSVVHTRFKESLLTCEITPAQYILLKCLWTEDGLSPTQLSQQTGLDASTITGLLTRMEKKELIERRHSKEDRRGITVCLLAQGKELRTRVEKVTEEGNREVLRNFTGAEQRQLKDYLARIAAQQ